MQGREFTVDVYPSIPGRLSRLSELAENLWYSWHRPTRALFASLNPRLWEHTGHNPKLFLQRVDQRVLEHAADDDVYYGNYQEALAAYDTYHQQTKPNAVFGELTDDDMVAYFCAEYGLHESLHIYSGGLGILAGHHCKTASDMRLPMVGVGLLYRAGYFSQAIDDEGRQIAGYVESDFDSLPIAPARDDNGKAIVVPIELPGRTILARVWQVRAGHVCVYLLDTSIDANTTDEDRRITYQLYDSDIDTRFKQEMVLGIGGVRALRALGLAPTVWHLNEGHPAFSIFERAREVVATGRPFATALEAVAGSTVFTTHTPVPAGHDYFPTSMVAQYLEPIREALGISEDQLIALGRTVDSGPDFNMTTLAIRGSRHVNAVSRIHRAVSAGLCADCWPQVPLEENPMDNITNGVHVPTVLYQDWTELFDRFLGAEWRNHLSDVTYWQRIHEISDQLFWSVRQSVKSKLLSVVRATLLEQFLRNQISESHIERLLKYVHPNNPNVLTIGFARRFATYKRALLLFEDLAWLAQLTSDKERPVVFMFAGKAHPADQPGQRLLQRVHEISCLREFAGRVLLVEGYDLALARRLVAGVDVWLNNPVYAMEACGTSGMKAAINGTINLSVTDGWWAEGFEGENGWAIKPSPHGDEEARRDAEDARTLYEILQDHVIPLYYDHGKEGFSTEWVRMAKRSMASILPRFNTHRALEEYARKLYIPAAHKGRRLNTQDQAGAEMLANWRKRVDTAWPKVGIRLFEHSKHSIAFGESSPIDVAVQLDGLGTEDVIVELLVSTRDGSQRAVASGGFVPDQTPLMGSRLRTDEVRSSLRFSPKDRLQETGEYRYELQFTPESCGRMHYRIRMYPWHELLSHPFEAGYMVWVE